MYYFGARYYDARVSRWISADPALAEGKYFPKPNDYDTEHDFYWYIFNDASGKLPGMGGVYNSININVYCYGGLNPVKFVDPDGNAYVLVHDNGKTEYLASTRVSNMAKSLYGFIPILGNEIYQMRCMAGKLYDLTDPKVVKNIIGKALDIGGLSNTKLGKLLNKIGLFFNITDFAQSISVNKAEFVIDKMNLFDGMDLKFIAANADKVAAEIANYIESGEIKVTGDFMTGSNIEIEDNLNLLGQIKDNLIGEYNRYQFGKDYDDN